MMKNDTLIFAPDSPFAATLRMAEIVARRDCPVFLRGESGVGKEGLARFLHRRGLRASGPFIAVNCAALPPNLIESELFGHRKGAFTGAHEDSPGKFRLAHGGTLFLDEVGDMPPDVQSRLLRVLQEKTVSPLGDRREHAVDFRLVCATHRDLRREVEAGRFREDLFYRLDVVAIRIPPLRERPVDIPLLIKHFLESLLPPDEAAVAMRDFPSSILKHPFPGNVRELRNFVERYCALKEMGARWEDVMESSNAPVAEMLPPASRDSGVVFSETLRRIRNSRVSDSQILNALDACGYHRARASDLLGISRRALQYRLVKMNECAITFGKRAEIASHL